MNQKNPNLNERTQESDTHICMSDLYLDFKDWYRENNPTTRIPNNRDFCDGIRTHKTIDRSVRGVGDKRSTGIKYLALKNKPINLFI